MLELQDRSACEQVVEVRGFELDRGQGHAALHATLKLEELDLQIAAEPRSGCSDFSCRSSAISRGSDRCGGGGWAGTPQDSSPPWSRKETVGESSSQIHQHGENFDGLDGSRGDQLKNGEIRRTHVWTFSCILAARTAHVCVRFQRVEILDSTHPTLKGAIVTIRLHLSRGTLPRAILLAVIVALVPLPVTAADNRKPPAKSSSLREAASTIAPRDLRPADRGRRDPEDAHPSARRSEQASSPATQSAAFFKSGAGIMVLSSLAVGVGYALYSASHDRITRQESSRRR